MQIVNFKQKNLVSLENCDNKYRQNGFAHFKNVYLTGRNMMYPNVLLYSVNDFSLTSPYDEKIMSLNKDSFYDNNTYDRPITLNEDEFTKINAPVFFFIYNFDNYYHYLYDTIPYLSNYFYLKKKYPTMRLLVNYPNIKKNEFYRFNLDILNKFVDIKNDLFLHDNNNVYENLYVSTSLTHGGFSNSPPNKEVYELFKMMIPNTMIHSSFNTYKYIYISRRTWINQDTSNIGTNYTTRRKMMNEDLLVEQLNKLGIKEIFTENLSIDEKIHLFNNAKLVIGSIGGGMSNLLFSPATTKSVVIVTPEFLDINLRFKYSMEHTDITYFNEVETYKEANTIPLFCRVKITAQGNYKEKHGEIVEYDNMVNKYKVNISNNDVAGFNNEATFENQWFFIEEFEILDKGLNSPYVVDIEKIISLIKKKFHVELLYTIINKTTNISYSLTIENIIKLITETPMDNYCKIIDDIEIPINNEIVINTKFICHRINTIDELNKIPNMFGVELDVRDEYFSKTLILSHDPYEKGCDFEDYLKLYNHGTLILNIKSERTELKCIELMKKYNITDYFFLDSNIPMTYLLNKKYNNSNIACRFSEFEPIEFYDKIKHFISWVWVDCFTLFPLSIENYNIFNCDNKKVCIVSPELQGQIDKIQTYRNDMIQNGIIPNAICCKLYNIIHWI